VHFTTDASGREHILVYDNHSDGHSAVAVYWVEGETGAPHRVWNSAGANSDPAEAIFNVPAGTSVKFRACLGESGPAQVMWDTCGETQQQASAQPGSAQPGSAQPGSAQPASAVAQPDRATGHTTGPIEQTGAVTAREPALLADALTVMTWNLGTGANFADLDGWAATIADHTPDIVGLQEACVTDVQGIVARLSSTYGLAYGVEFGTVQNKVNCNEPFGGAFGQATLSLRTMSSPVHDTYDIQDPSETRGYMAVTVLVDGVPVRVFNTHLENASAEVGTAQARELAGLTMATPYALVLGDFNKEPQDGRGTIDQPPATQTGLTPMWNAGFRDVDRDCNRNTNPGCAVSQIGAGKKFDYIFMRLLTEVGQPTVPDTTFSDHRPVIGVVQLSPGASNTVACNYGSCIAEVTFQALGEHLFVRDTNANGLSAVGVYWVQGAGPGQTVVWNPNTADGPGNPVDADLDIAEGNWIMYTSCSGYFTQRRVFWDTCGDLRLNPS
jgi:endonuclease/exonuclease/phosphatase family metal-dependent hydrolase